MKLLELYRNIVPQEVRRAYNIFFQQIKTKCQNRLLMEKKRFGDQNKDKTFYVIRTDSTQEWGIATACIMVLNNIVYAERKGWIPVVDYKNCFLSNCLDEWERGKRNAWEEYFEQPADYSLEEVYNSRHVVLGPLRGQPVGSLSWNDVNDMYAERYSPYFEAAHKYIRLKPEILQRAESIRGTFLEKTGGRKILGMGMRVGLYWAELTNCKNYLHHPKGVSIDEYIQSAYKYMDNFNCEYIFVSCEDRYGLERMKQEFGEKCLYVENRTLLRYFDDQGNALMKPEERRAEIDQESIVKRSIDYMTEIYILSKCDSIYRVSGGGATLACLLNNRKYEHCYSVKRGVIE